LIWYQI